VPDASLGFHSTLAWLLEEFVLEKRGLGYCYKAGVNKLRQLERLWRENPESPPALTREWAERFISVRPTENNSVSAIGRVGVWRQLARFCRRRGIDAYLPDARSVPMVGAPYTPFIYTREQVAALFAAADALPIHCFSPRRPWAMGLLYRLLYGTGLRLSEALGIHYRDFTPDTGILLVRRGKNRNERAIPVAPSVAERLRTHIRLFPDEPDTPFFLSPRRRAALNISAVGIFFPRLLQAADLPPRAGRKGPRIHDLRHTFAVHRMENWIRAGEDPEAKIPLLASYMGHVCLRDTYYYLRVTRQLFPMIAGRTQAHVGAIVPEGDHS